MPILGSNSLSGGLDTQSTSGDRHRRNWQKVAEGAVTNTLLLNPAGALNKTIGLGINVDNTDIIINASNALSVGLNTAGAIVTGSGGLSVNVNGTDTQIKSNTIVVGLNTAGAIQSGVGGLSVKVDGVTVQIIGDQLVSIGGSSNISQVALAFGGGTTITGSTSNTSFGPTYTFNGQTAGDILRITGIFSAVCGVANTLSINLQIGSTSVSLPLSSYAISSNVIFKTETFLYFNSINSSTGQVSVITNIFGFTPTVGTGITIVTTSSVNTVNGVLGFFGQWGLNNADSAVENLFLVEWIKH